MGMWAARKARRQYELAVLEGLIAANRRHLERLADIKECPICMAMEGSEQRSVCKEAQS